MKRRSVIAASLACIIMWLSAIAPVAFAQEVLTPCFVKLSIYEGIPGVTVAELRADPDYPANPSQVHYLTSLNTQEVIPGGDALNEFGGRIEGFITPQESGDYYFFLRSDDGSELLLSDDESEARAYLIAWEDDCCDAFMEPESFDSATTLDPISLTAGQRYYILVEYKDNTGGDYAQVAWRKAGDTTPATSLAPIPAAYLSANIDAGQATPITFTEQPQAVTGEENSEATFTVGVDFGGAAFSCIQWQKDGVNIPGANDPTHTVLLSKADQGARFRALAAVPGGFELSAEAAVTVTDDTTPPALLAVDAVPNGPQVVLTFSERVSDATATNTANYQIAGGGGGLAVLQAVLSADMTQVTLTTAAPVLGTEYTVTVNNLQDMATPPNAIAAGSQGTYVAVGALLQNEAGFVVWEAEDYDRNLDGRWVEDTARGEPSAGMAMLIPNGVGGSEAETKLEYDIIFTHTGTHILWYRAGSDSGNDDSAWLHVDGARPPNRLNENDAGMAGFNGDVWEWNSSPVTGAAPMTFDIATAGLHTIGLCRREDGAFFDKFVITTDAGFDPDDFGAFGPPVTLREGEPVEPGAEVEITVDPVDAEGLEGQPLSVPAEAYIPPGSLTVLQWQRKEGDTFVDIPGQTGTALVIDALTMDWNGAVVRMRVIGVGTSDTSAEATITVLQDTAPPELLRASGVAPTQRVTLFFSEPLDPVTAGQAANYGVVGPAGAVAVNAATLLASGTVVLLDTGAQTVGAKYTVTVDGVRDLAVTPNTALGEQAKFYSLGDLLPQGADGLLVFEAESYDRNLDGLWVEDFGRGEPSGGVAMVVPNGAADNEANTQLEYDLTFTQTGTHIVWYRVGADSGSDDSAWLHLDGARPAERAAGNLASMSGFQGALWIWTSDPQEGASPMTFELAAAGPHTIGLASREDGAFFDKFVITTDPDFDPEDFGPLGPAETRAGAPPMPTLAISAPASPAEVPEGADIEFTVDISPTTREIARVEYFAGATKLGESTQSPFGFTWQDAPTGGYAVYAQLTDDVGDSVRSQEVLVQVGEPNDILFLVGDDDLAAAPGDAAFLAYLESLGFRVFVVEDVDSVTTDAFGKKLVVDSSTVDSGAIGTKYRDVAVPVLLWEQANEDDFGMTLDVEGVDRGYATAGTDIQILDVDHPLNGGFPAGIVTITSAPRAFAWGLPNANATTVATIPGAPQQAVLYGYETGAEMMNGIIAPARRVLVFLNGDAFLDLTADGLALVDAALEWALGEEPVTPDQEIVITSMTRVPAGITLTWATNAAPPYTVQRKGALGDATWVDALTTHQTTATVPAAAVAAFFRVVK